MISFVTGHQSNLLINYIEGEDTDAVELLLPRGCPHSVKCAAGNNKELQFTQKFT